MAALIFHGPPGSYKTSSAIWFELLSSLRQGRIVVTNIEGIKTKDQMEIELNETFPESADIWRLSSQNETGRELWRRFFHWCPVGARIIIDEIQDVFPNDRTFKPEKYDHKDVREYEGLIPEKWLTKHISLLDSIKPEDIKIEDTDDTGTPIFNQHGHIIYPHTLRESFMRHRKYQWDIVVCTPNITEVHGLIRGACEHAYKHTSKDDFGKVIPYFKRRPRITQHPPKESCITPKKSDIGFYRKVPTDVHKLYKSTATGKHNTSGSGKSPLASPAIVSILALIVFCVSYVIYAVSTYESPADAAMETYAKTNQINIAEGSKNISASIPAVVNSDISKTVGSAVSALALPYRPTQAYITGTEIIKKNDRSSIVGYFRFVSPAGEYYLTSSDVRGHGYQVSFHSECSATIKNENIEVVVHCPIKNLVQSFVQNNTKPTVSIF